MWNIFDIFFCWTKLLKSCYRHLQRAKFSEIWQASKKNPEIRIGDKNVIVGISIRCNLSFTFCKNSHFDWYVFTPLFTHPNISFFFFFDFMFSTFFFVTVLVITFFLSECVCASLLSFIELISWILLTSTFTLIKLFWVLTFREFQVTPCDDIGTGCKSFGSSSWTLDRFREKKSFFVFLYLLVHFLFELWWHQTTKERTKKKRKMERLKVRKEDVSGM